MQNVHRATAGLAELARAIAVPAESLPHRLPSFPALEKTAVMQYKVVQNIGVGTADGSNQAFTPVCVCRDPAYPVWTAFPMAGKYSAYCAHAFSAPHVVPVGETWDVPAGFIAGMSRYEMENATGKAYPIGYANGNYYVYGCPSGGVAKYLELVTNNVTCNITLHFAIWMGGEEAMHKVDFSNDITAQIARCPVSFGQGFWRPLFIEVRSGTLSFSAIRIGISSGQSLLDPTDRPTPTTYFLPLAAPPEFSTASAIWHNVRTTAVGVLCQNVTAALHKEGTVRAARLYYNNSGRTGQLSTYVDFFNPRESMVSIVHPDDRYNGPLEKGFYCYAPPDETSDEFVNASTPTALSMGYYSSGVHPVFNLGTLSWFTLAVFTDLDPTFQTTLQVVLDWHIEFRTSSILFPRKASQYSLEHYHGAQLALARMGTMFENPIHLRDIARHAMQAAKSVIPMLYPVAKQALIRAHPTAAPLLMAAETLVKQGQRGGKKQKKKTGKPGRRNNRSKKTQGN